MSDEYLLDEDGGFLFTEDAQKIIVESDDIFFPASWVSSNRGLGLWNFTEQPNKWGYLNNSRWSKQPKAVAFSEAVGNPIDPTNTHVPCGHWHKHSGDEAITVTRTSPAPDINIGTEGWWQPSVDVKNGKISLFPIRHDGGICCPVYDVATETWMMLGYEDVLVLYGEPNTGRSTENYSAYYCTCWAYDWLGLPADPEYGKYYGRLYIFEEGEEPRHTDVWEGDYFTDTPYEFYDYGIYNKMDCIGNKIACLAWEIKRAGVVYDRWTIKFSEDAGLTFPNEFSFPQVQTWAAGYAWDCEIRMSEDGYLWACLAYYSPTSQFIQLWKSNVAFDSMSLLWEYDYIGDTGQKVNSFGWDISNEDGEYIYISLDNSGGGTGMTLYVSDDYGITFTTKTANPENMLIYTTLTAEKQHITALAKNTPLNKYGFARSTDYGDNFSWLVAVITYGGLTNHYIDVVNKTYINNNTIMCNRQGITGSTVGNSRIFTADPSPDVSHSYVDMQKHFNENVYVECGESYTGGDYQDLLYSEDNGATWKIIESPINIIDFVAGVEDVIFSSTVVVVTTTELNEPQVWQI